MTAVLEQAALVEAARLSLVKPLVETNKIFATKDLDDNEVDDLLERLRSVVMRTDYIEPFCEHVPLSHTLMSLSRVSPSRSVGTVSPTNDLSLVPSVVETTLEQADVSISDVSFQEESVPTEGVTELEDVEMLCSTSSLVQVALDEVDVHVCDVLFEEEMIPAEPQEVARPPVPVPNYDSTDLFVVEDNLPDAVSVMDDVDEWFTCPTEISVQLYRATETDVDVRECEDEIISPHRAPVVERPRVNWPEERSASPFIFDEYFLEPRGVETATLTPVDVEDVVLGKVSILEEDVYFIEEEKLIVEATVDLQQLLKMTELEMNYSEQRSVSPFTDERTVLKPIISDVYYLTLAPQDHVTEPLAYAQTHEADVYYYEEESVCVDVVCDLTQIMRTTQRELIVSEEQLALPVQDEAIFMQPLSADVELMSIDAVDHVESPLSRARVDECDVYYYEEESVCVDVVCDFRQLVQHSTSSFSVEERVAPETVQLESSVHQTSAQRSDIKPTGVDVAATNLSSETFVLPQVIVRRVEATSRLSPLPAGIMAASSSTSSTALNTASVDECTLYSHDEETFTESTLEQTTSFEQRLETSKDQQEHFHQQLETEEEISAEVTVDKKSRFEAERLEVPEDDVEMYSSGEETYERWTVETYRIYVETRNVEADVTFRRSKQLGATASDTWRGMSCLLIISLFLNLLSILLCLLGYTKVYGVQVSDAAFRSLRLKLKRTYKPVRLSHFTTTCAVMFLSVVVSCARRRIHTLHLLARTTH